MLDALPKGINYAGYIGHSALRTYAMGERLQRDRHRGRYWRMQAVVQEAMHAGAVGFSTSRTFNHITADDRLVASRLPNGTRFAP